MRPRSTRHSACRPGLCVALLFAYLACNCCAQNDTFGISMLYPTKAGGEKWYMNMQAPASDARFEPGSLTLTKNTDGSWKIQNTQVRLQVYTSTGFDVTKIASLDQPTMASQGYMQAANDWENIEMTGYMRLNAYTTSTTNGAAHFEFQSAGGRHTSCCPCEGTAYHANLYQIPPGRVKFEKELSHTAGYTNNDPQKLNATDSLTGRWIGVKAVFYRLPGNRMKLEHWLDDSSNNQWRLVHAYVDSGQWSTTTGQCGGTANQVITWGGPLVTFRWDNLSDVDLKFLSVREIRAEPTPVRSGPNAMRRAANGGSGRVVRHIVLKKANSRSPERPSVRIVFGNALLDLRGRTKP
jgi:hypothetical protein